MSLKGITIPVWVDLLVMAIKRYSPLSQSPKLEPHHKLNSSVRSNKIHEKCTQRILSPIYIWWIWTPLED